MALLKKAGILVGALAMVTNAADAQTVSAIENKPDLTAEAAKIIGDTCIDMARKNGWRQAVTVINARQQLLYYHRMDGTSDIGAETSGLKAKTAFYTRRIGRDIGPLNADFLRDRGMLPSPGAIPIISNGALVGAVGVGGGVSLHDHECGMAGLAKVGLAPANVPPEALAAKPSAPAH